MSKQLETRNKSRSAIDPSLPTRPENTINMFCEKMQPAHMVQERIFETQCMSKVTDLYTPPTIQTTDLYTPPTNQATEPTAKDFAEQKIWADQCLLKIDDMLRMLSGLKLRGPDAEKKQFSDMETCLTEFRRGMQAISDQPIPVA